MGEFLTDKPIVYLDGVESSRYNLCVSERPNIPTPKRKQLINDSSFSERGSYRINTGWDDITIKITFNYLESVEETGASFRMAFSKIRGFILQTKQLAFNDDMGVYYKVKNVEIDEAINTIIEYGEFSASFTCSPFGYLNDNNLPIIYDSVNNGVDPVQVSQVITNDSFYTAYPTIRFPYKNLDTSLDPPAISISRITQNGDSTQFYEWNMKVRIYATDGTTKLTWPANFDLVIDSENTLVYFENPEDGEIMDGSKYVNMRNFPELPVGACRVTNNYNSDVTSKQKWKYRMEITRNVVI